LPLSALKQIPVNDGLVIIPTYNEKENIERMVRKVMSLPVAFDLLIVDDMSPDGTGNIIKKLIPEFPDRLFLLERTEKNGLGTAYISGFRWALNRGYAFVFEMDADFSHNPDDLSKLYRAVKEEGADLAIGSRYLTGVNVVNWPIGRVLLSYYASVYVRFITGMKIMDTTAGFKCYKRKVLETIDLDKIKFKGYAFQIEMKFVAHTLGFVLKEVPIIFTERQEGTSKLSSGIIKEAVFGVMNMKLRAIFGRIKPLSST
jgi:dolichol-phosphate mannosyltransferase